MFTAVVAAILLLTALPLGSARAADIPTYDGNTARTRMVTDPSLSPTQLYLSVPTYLPLSGQSLSTPTVVGNTLYQYTYSGATGTLYAVKLPDINGSSVLTQYHYALPGFLTRSVQYVEPPLVFKPSEGAYGADAQDSLTTAEGWQAIAVGRHLYAWPVGQWPTSQQTIPVHVKILTAAATSTRFQVDMNPLITPPIGVQVFNTKIGQNQTVQAPMAVACSWDGGCASVALGLPSYDLMLSNIAYKATQDFPSDTQAAITSDPVFIKHEPLFNNDPAVAFGIASWSHPRVELLDLVTGRAKAIGTSGAGQIHAAIADAGMLATTSGGRSYLVYHDEYGDVYSFNLDGAPSAAPILSGSSTIELAEDGSQTSPQYPGTTGAVAQPVVGKNELLFAALPKTNQPSMVFSQYADVSSPSTVYGSSVPSDLCSDSSNPDICRYVTAWSFSAFSAPIGHNTYESGIELDPQFGAGSNSVNTLDGSDFGNEGQFIAANVSPYVGPVLDAGPEHYVMSWTNQAPQDGGAVVLYAPVNYAVAATGPSSVASGGGGTILAKPVPSGVTHDRIPGADGDVCNITGSPMTLDLSSSIGKVDTISMARTTAPTVASPWSVWSGNFKLPANTTGASVKWTGTVTAIDKYCSPAKAQVTITELSGSTTPPPPPPPPPPSSSGGAGLTLNPNPALYGQQITATLAPDTPTAPTVTSGDKLLSWTWRIDASPTLNYPLKPSTWAFGFPVVATQAKTIPMTVSGHSATASFMENWWDGGCHTKLAGACTWITNGFWMTGQGGPQYIPAHNWPVTASYTITVSYSYEYPVTTWAPNPACATDSPPKDCNSKGETPTTTWDTKQASETLPASSASANLDTDGTAIDSVGGG